MASLLKTLKGKGVGTIVMLLLILFGAYYFASYLTSKGSAGHEAAGESMKAAYGNAPAPGVQPAAPMGETRFTPQLREPKPVCLLLLPHALPQAFRILLNFYPKRQEVANLPN